MKFLISNEAQAPGFRAVHSHIRQGSRWVNRDTQARKSLHANDALAALVADIGFEAPFVPGYSLAKKGAFLEA